MRKYILISVYFAMAFGLFGCVNPNTTYRIYYSNGSVDLASPYDDPRASRTPN